MNKSIFGLLSLLLSLALAGCETTSSSSSQSEQEGNSSTGSTTSSGSQAPATQSGMPGGLPGQQSAQLPGDSSGRDSGKESSDSSNDSDDILLEEPESAGSENQGPETLEGLGVEDAIGDTTLEEALEAFEQPVTPALGKGDGEAPETAGNNGENTGSQGARSEEEELAALNRELDQALAKFDNVILGERESISDYENAGAGSYPAGGETGDFEEGEQQPGDFPGNKEAGTGGGTMPNLPGKNTTKGDYAPTASADSIPPDIPDGSDDDVVARQIREAAMRETDPELREKLWDEYRKYKKGGK
jgi:hypothetical protein